MQDMQGFSPENYKALSVDNEEDPRKWRERPRQWKTRCCDDVSSPPNDPESVRSQWKQF